MSQKLHINRIIIGQSQKCGQAHCKNIQPQQYFDQYILLLVMFGIMMGMVIKIF
jgi:hypothetical protein